MYLSKCWGNALFLIIFSILAVVFYQNGDIDLIVSKYFYNPDLGGFYLKDHIFPQIVHKGVPIITASLVLGMLIAGINKLMKVRSVHPKHYIAIIYLMLVCLLGPGLVVNVLFKEHFGRARPNQVVEFGGAAKFTPAFMVSNACNHNCSFVSGHASIGFLFCAFAFLYRDIRRIYFNLLGISLGVLFGLGRIMQGAHFLSDVIFSGVFVYITAYLLAKLLIPARQYE